MIKKLFAGFILMVALASTSIAQVQYGTATLVSGGTNNVAATATNTYSLTAIPAKMTQNVALYVSCKGISGTPANTTFVFAPSLDGTTVPTVTDQDVRIVVAGNGTTVVGQATNSSVGSFGFLKLRSIENTNSVAITNITVIYAVKQNQVR